MNLGRIQYLSSTLTLGLLLLTLPAPADNPAAIQDSLAQIRIATLIPSPSARTLDTVKEYTARLEKDGATNTQLSEAYLIQSCIANKLGLTEESKAVLQKSQSLNSQDKSTSTDKNNKTSPFNALNKTDQTGN